MAKGRSTQGTGSGRQQAGAQQGAQGGQGGRAGGRSGRSGPGQGDTESPRRRRQRAKDEREERVVQQQATAERGNRNLIISSVVGVVIVAVGLIAFGWYQTEIKPLSKTVLSVGEIEYDLAHFERRMRLTIETDPTFLTNQALFAALPDFTMNELQNEAILLESAGELDIAVSEEEIDAEIRTRAGLADEADASLFAEAYRAQVEASPLNESEFRQFLRAQLLEVKARSYFTYLAPPSEPQVRSRWIVLDSESEEIGERVLERLDAGEDFSDLALELSIDTLSAEEGGLIEWRPRGNFPSEEIEDYLLDTAAVGDHSDVLEASGLHYIVLLLDRDDDRALEPDQRLTVGNRQLTEWLGDAIGRLDIRTALSPEDRNRALGDLL